MIDAELLNKFDRIQDLPVSEEMLGAYFEGNLDCDEFSLIEDLLSSNIIANDIVNEIPESEVAQTDLGTLVSYHHIIDNIILPDIEVALGVANSENLIQENECKNAVSIGMVSSLDIELDNSFENNLYSDDGYAANVDFIGIGSAEDGDLFNDNDSFNDDLTDY